MNRDRRSVALDLTSTQGRAVARRLAGAADVVVENFLPRHLAALEELLTALGLSDAQVAEVVRADRR